VNALPEMPCQELVEVLTDYLDGVLEERDRLRLEAHLEECEACSAYLEEFRMLITAAGRIEPEQISPELEVGLLQAFRDLRL
jgi:anti-sigma factor RsiW